MFNVRIIEDNVLYQSKMLFNLNLFVVLVLMRRLTNGYKTYQKIEKMKKGEELVTKGENFIYLIKRIK